jgi:AraC-like DNA-binding protein
MSSTITLHSISLVALFGITIGIVLSGVLLSTFAGNKNANRYLSAILLTHCVAAFSYVIVQENFYAGRYFYTLASLQMCFGPLLLLYTSAMTVPDFRWSHRHFLHLLPAVMMGLVWYGQLHLDFFDGLTLSCPDERVSCDIAYQERFVHRLAAWISLIVYGVLSLKVLRVHRKRIKSVYSALEKMNLNWLNLIIFSLFLITLLAVMLDVRYYLMGKTNFVGGVLLGLGPLIFSLLMGWFGFRQKGFLDNELPSSSKSIDRKTESNSQLALDQETNKYQTSSLSNEAASEIWANLLEVMVKEEPHLENGLKISTLAQQLDISVNHLSETINGYANQSFYDFVNKYRVEEAQRLLVDESKTYMSVTEIGFHAGFNSDSTFFNHFKKATKLTPRQFRKKK